MRRNRTGARRGGLQMAKRRQLTVYLAPAVLLGLTFIVFPLVFVLAMSLTEWAGIGPAKFIGASNYRYLLHDPTFHTAVVNTLIWGAVGIFVQTPLCLLAALILSRRPVMWKTLRTVLFIPSVVSTTILALMWYFMFDPTLGLVNGVLHALHLHSLERPWLSDPSSALWAVMVPFVIYIGFGMVLFMTQISTIPRELFEAARLDGARAWYQDATLTIPLIRRAIALWALFIVGYVLRMFEYPFVMTNGGPADKTMNLSLYIYNEMVKANAYGLAMAAGVVTLVIGAALMSCVLLGLRWIEAV